MRDHPTEDEIVEEEVDDADGDDVHPARLVFALQYAEDEKVEQPAGECESDRDVQHVRDHVRSACERDLHGKEGGCDEEEGELDRLGDAREHTGECCREQETARDFFLFGARRMVHGERRARQTEDHEDELAREVARRIGAEMNDIRGGELREEDVLTTLDELSVDHHGAADTRLPEGEVEDVVQTERNERALDDAEDERTDVARPRNETAEGEDALLGERPDEVHGDADKEKDHRRDDRDEARSAEEGERIRQDDLVVLIVQPRDADADDDAAEYAHLERHDAAGCRDRALEHMRRDAPVRQDLPAELQHGVARGVHDEERDHRGERRDFLFRLCHADGDADGEDDRQISEDGAARTCHDGEQRMQRRAAPEDAAETVRLYRRWVGERRADAEQDACDRQNGDGQHEAAANPLEHTENLIFHICDPFPPRRSLHIPPKTL